jgi:hypothetical protein
MCKKEARGDMCELLQHTCISQELKWVLCDENEVVVCKCEYYALLFYLLLIDNSDENQQQHNQFIGCVVLNVHTFRVLVVLR